MELKHSVNGIPYIEFSEDTRLVFVKLTPNDKGFKWFTINTFQKTYIGKARKEIDEKFDVVVDIGLSTPKGFSSEVLTKKKLAFLRKIFKNYQNGNGTIPLTAIPEIAEEISNYKERKTRSDAGKPKKRVRKTVAVIKADENGDIKVSKADRNGDIKPKKKESKPKSKPKPKLKPAAVPVQLGKVCKSCKRELFQVPSCNSLMLVGHGQRWKPIVHKGKENCKYCGVMPGGRHHLYCPEEECPRCGKKMMVCGCFK